MLTLPRLFDEVDRGLLCHHGKYSKKVVNKLKFCDLKSNLGINKG